MEEFDIYDFERNATGRAFRKGKTFEKGEYHLIVHLCIFNTAGEMLIQQRQPFKEKWPELWDVTVGGKVAQGESSQEGIQRELKEELGLELDFSGIRPRMTLNHPVGFDDFFVIEKDIDLGKLTLQADEVKAVKWASEQEILGMIDRGEFIPYYAHLINLLFDMRKNYGYIHHTK